MRSPQILLNACAVLAWRVEFKRLNNVLPRSFRVEVIMQHGIAIDLFSLKRDGLKSRGGGGGGCGTYQVMTSLMNPMFWKNVGLL